MIYIQIHQNSLFFHTKILFLSNKIKYYLPIQICKLYSSLKNKNKNSLLSFTSSSLLPEMDNNSHKNSESPKNPNVSFDTFDSDESVIFIKETFNIKYHGPLPKPKPKNHNQSSVHMKKVDITKPPPPSSKYIHTYIYY